MNHGPKFRWLERGEGDPVLLLHGLMGSMDHWEATLEALGERYRAIALELPIFDPALPEISFASLTRHLVAFLDALEIPHAIVGGNSLGGHLALELALNRPDRLSGLVLTGSSGLFERAFTRGAPHRPTPEYVRDRMHEVFFDPAMVTDSDVNAVHRILNDRRLARRVLQAARAARHHNLEDRLREIRVPTLIVWGSADRITPPSVAERFHALIQHSELMFLGRCGHAPMLERPDAFNAMLSWWLGELRGRRRSLTVLETAP